MSVTANREIAINTTGDSILNKIYPAAESLVSPGSITVLDLAAGFNPITVPVATGVVVKAATIIPPAGNEETITLKGVTGDTGVLLHKTDPTSIGLDTTVTTFGLTAGAIIAGVRIVWT